MDKTLTEQQIRDTATANGIDYAALRAVIGVETCGHGFNQDGLPIILFERHIFYKRLTQKNLITIRNTAFQQRPDICNPSPGGYGASSIQHSRLTAATTFNRDCALESASWGLGQVMGYQWQSLGYPSLQSFINAMYQDEASQLDAMCRYVKVNNLITALNNHNWAAFAKGYNGANYAQNQYDKKLAVAYRQFA